MKTVILLCLIALTIEHKDPIFVDNFKPQYEKGCLNLHKGDQGLLACASIPSIQKVGVSETSAKLSLSNLHSIKVIIFREENYQQYIEEFTKHSSNLAKREFKSMLIIQEGCYAILPCDVRSFISAYSACDVKVLGKNTQKKVIGGPHFKMNDHNENECLPQEENVTIMNVHTIEAYKTDEQKSFSYGLLLGMTQCRDEDTIMKCIRGEKKNNEDKLEIAELKDSKFLATLLNYSNYMKNLLNSFGICKMQSWIYTFVSWFSTILYAKNVLPLPTLHNRKKLRKTLFLEKLNDMKDRFVDFAKELILDLSKLYNQILTIGSKIASCVQVSFDASLSIYYSTYGLIYQIKAFTNKGPELFLLAIADLMIALICNNEKLVNIVNLSNAVSAQKHIQSRLFFQGNVIGSILNYIGTAPSISSAFVMVEAQLKKA